MDIAKAFEDFLDKKVNLNPARVDRIKEAERVLSKFIAENPTFKDLYVTTIPQGSFRQKTIIKPSDEDCKFDVDLLIGLKEKDGWSPKDYINNLAKEFRASGRYKDITDTRGKTRCVTIDYEGEFHVDLVPAVITPTGPKICNKTTDQFESTDGDGYAQWFEGRDAAANGYLVPAVRLIKYLRDSKKEFDTKSIILTTIAGMQVHPGGAYGSLPEAFATILSGMSDYLAQFAAPPSVQNPAMPGEFFDRHWKDDQEGFEDLRAAMTIYAQTALKAARSLDVKDAATAWGELFGDSFSPSEGIKGLVSTVAPGIASTIPYTPAASFQPQRTYGSDI